MRNSIYYNSNNMIPEWNYVTEKSMGDIMKLEFKGKEKVVGVRVGDCQEDLPLSDFLEMFREFCKKNHLQEIKSLPKSGQTNRKKKVQTPSTVRRGKTVECCQCGKQSSRSGMYCGNCGREATTYCHKNHTNYLSCPECTAKYII